MEILKSNLPTASADLGDRRKREDMKRALAAKYDSSVEGNDRQRKPNYFYFAGDSGMVPETNREERELMLEMEFGNISNRFNPEGQFGPTAGGYIKEDNPMAKEFIEDELFADVGYKGDSVDDPWSAATVSKLAKAFDPEFEGSAGHHSYIGKAFRGEGKYKPERIRSGLRKGSDDFQVGDILFQGREETSDWDFRDFADAGKDGRSYPSHSDIIVGFVEKKDDKGKMRKYAHVVGGNVGNTLKDEYIPVDDLQKSYKGRLTQE